MAKRSKQSTEVQTLLFDKGKWNKTTAKKWLKDHGYKIPAKVEGSGEYHRYRQHPPFHYVKGSFRTITFGKTSNGIKAIVAIPRNGKPKPNPAIKGLKKARKSSRIPALLVDLADAREVELEDGQVLKFRLSGKFALCTNKAADELWIMSRSGGKRVATEDTKAETLFEKFTGFEADDAGELVQLPEFCLERLGRAKNIIYRSDKFSSLDSDYIHAFKKYPTVSVDNKTRPRIVAIRGGQIRVTAEGITG